VITRCLAIAGRTARCSLLHQLARVGVSPHTGPKLFGCEIIFEEFQSIWSLRTDGQTDRQTDGQTIYDRNTALCTKVHRAVTSLRFYQSFVRISFQRRHISDRNFRTFSRDIFPPDIFPRSITPTGEYMYVQWQMSGSISDFTSDAFFQHRSTPDSYDKVGLLACYLIYCHRQSYLRTENLSISNRR